MGQMFSRYDDPNYVNNTNNCEIEDTCISDIKNIIFRGTTLLHSFTIPTEVKDISKVIITYVQGVDIILEKVFDEEVNNAEIYLKANTDDTYTINFTLTQEETFLFKPTYSTDPVKIQLKILQTNGNVITSEVYRMRVEDCLNKEVIE